jgi:hypothetical protein
MRIVYTKSNSIRWRVDMTMLTGNQIHKARLLALQSAMSLEAKGLKMSRGRTAMSIVKQEFGFKGNRSKIQAQLQTVIDSMPNTP